MPRHIPLRKCIGCQSMFPKEELLRVVKTPLGEVLADTNGKMEGRGAYICRNASCLEKAAKQRGLEKSFHGRVNVSIYETIRQEGF